MPRRLMPGWSDTVSTGCDRKSGGQDGASRVHVPVVVVPAPGTPPPTHVQRQAVDPRSAGRAGLARRKPPIDGDHIASVPLRLVLQHGPELRPTRVGDRSRQGPVPQHPGHVEVLDHDRLVLTNEPSGDLVEVVAPSVGDPGDSAAGLVPVGRSSGLAGEAPLGGGEPGVIVPLVPRVGDLLAGREREQCRDPDIDTDGGRDGHVVRDRGLDQDRHEPASSRIAGHRDRGRLRAAGQRTRPDDVQWLGHLREGEPPITPPERRPRVLSRRTRTFARLEPRVPAALAEEVRERLLQVPQGLLQWNAGDLGEERQIRIAFPLGEHRRGLGVAQVGTRRVPSRRARVQCSVEDKTCTTERAQQLLGLPRCRTEAVLERPLHQRRPHASQDDRPARVTGLRGTTSPPADGLGQAKSATTSTGSIRLEFR